MGRLAALLAICVYADINRSIQAASCVDIDVNKLNEATTCSELSLESRELNDVGIQKVATALKTVLPNVKELYIWDNQVSSRGVRELSGALQGHGSLTTVYMQSNAIRGEGSHYLCNALMHNSIITSLDVGDNDLRGNVTAFAGMLSTANSSLEHLSLARNSIFDRGASDLADALRLNTNLKTIDLSNNRIGDDGATEIGEALKLNPTLSTINLLENPVWELGAQAIAEALRFNTALVDVQIDGLAEAFAMSGAGNKAKESRRLSRKVRLEHVHAIEQGKTIEDPTLTLKISPETAAALFAELAINQSPTSKAAIEKAKRVQTQYPCAGQTSRQLCHSRGYPAERAHNSDYVKLSDGSCICAPCLAGFTGVYCEQVDVCLARTSETFCSGHGKPVIDNGECRCSPCFHAEGTHGYHGDQCKKRACNSSDIFSSGPSSATRGKSGNSISIPADCTELKLQSIGLRSTGCAALVDALAEQKNEITQISLQHNFIGKAGAAALARLVKNNKRITTINLFWTPIYNLGAAALFEALKVNTVLTELGLFQNTVDDDDLLKNIESELAKNSDPHLLKEKKKKLSKLKEVCQGKSASALCHGKGKIVPIFDDEGPFCGCHDCHDGYSGVHCHIFTPCFSDRESGTNFCFGHGTPEESKDGKRCTCSSCDEGFTGARCEKHDPCTSKTRESFCNSHGTPHTIESGITGTVRCECQDCDRAWSGPRCNRFDPCFGKTKANLCFNRGQPTTVALLDRGAESSSGGGSETQCVCTGCTHGYSGEWCSTPPLCRAGTAAFEGACVEDCPSGMYATNARVCDTCNENCLFGLCTGPGPSGCNECKAYTHITMDVTGAQVVCVDKCGVDEAPDEMMVCNDADSNPASSWALEHQLGGTFAATLHKKRITLTQLAGLTHDELFTAVPFSDGAKLKRVINLLRTALVDEYLELLEDAGLEEAIKVCSCTGGAASAGPEDGEGGGGACLFADTLTSGAECEFSTQTDFDIAFAAHPAHLAMQTALCSTCASLEEYEAWARTKDASCALALQAAQELASLYHPPALPCNFPYCSTISVVLDERDEGVDSDIVSTWAANAMTRSLRALLKECRPRRSRWY